VRDRLGECAPGARAVTVQRQAPHPGLGRVCHCLGSRSACAVCSDRGSAEGGTPARRRRRAAQGLAERCSSRPSACASRGLQPSGRSRRRAGGPGILLPAAGVHGAAGAAAARRDAALGRADAARDAQQHAQLPGGRPAAVRCLVGRRARRSSLRGLAGVWVRRCVCLRCGCGRTPENAGRSPRQGSFCGVEAGAAASVTAALRLTVARLRLEGKECQADESVASAALQAFASQQQAAAAQSLAAAAAPHAAMSGNAGAPAAGVVYQALPATWRGPACEGIFLPGVWRA